MLLTEVAKEVLAPSLAESYGRFDPKLQELKYVLYLTVQTLLVGEGAKRCWAM